MADLDLDRLEALARESFERRWTFTHVLPDEILRLIARLREAEDAMNVCARCGEAIDAEVQADLAARNDRLWPEGWVTHECPVYEGRRFTHSVRFHERPEVQAEEADAATPTPSTPNTP